VKWFRKAAEQNLADAQYNLGVCYDSGEGVAKDVFRQIYFPAWTRMAAWFVSAVVSLLLLKIVGAFDVNPIGIAAP
jgi:Sel1 repeat